jgi:pyrroline-5-carboxylate reductase
VSSLRTIGFIGAGQMALALASGISRTSTFSQASIYATEPNNEAWQRFQTSVPKAQRLNDNLELFQKCECIFLSVKPQIAPVVFAELQHQTFTNHLVVSIVAGLKLSTLQQGIRGTRLVRVMPNTPALIGAGVSAITPDVSATESDRNNVSNLLQSVGETVFVQEELLDSVTGLSGSGPAYVFTFIEALSDGGVRMGLPREVATKLAVQTVLGSAAMMKTTEKHAGELRDQVTSPGGTTIAGLHELERGGFRAVVMNAVEAASKRATELGQSNPASGKR